MNRFIEKAFPKPEPGAARIIPSRHPLQISLMVAFIIMSLFQLYDGPSPDSVLYSVDPTVGIFLTVATLVGSTLCLLAAWFAERNPWNALGFSLGGFTILSVVWIYNTLMYSSLADFASISTFWISFCLTVGFVVRCGQLAVDAYRIWRHK